MRSGLRLEYAIRAAEKDTVDGPACPPAAGAEPESANVMASDAAWCAERNAARKEAMAGHVRRPPWSYVDEVERRIDRHLQSRRAGRTC